MLKIKRFLLAHKVIAAFLAILMMSSFAFAANYFSKPDEKATNCAWYQNRYYYSDASHTTQVGYWVWFCDGLIGRSGQQTPY
jgi:hypothetical protein